MVLKAELSLEWYLFKAELSLEWYLFKTELCLEWVLIVQELCESRGGRPGLSILTSLLVSMDVKLY